MKLYAANVSVLDDPELFAKGLALIGKERREKTEKIRPLPEKKRSVGAGLLLRYGLLQAGVPVCEQLFALEENKKPCLRNRKDVCFNLSHSGELVLLAVAVHPVGCDVQKKEPISLKIADRFFHPEETALVRGESDPASQNDLLNRIWCRKESVVKTSGLGLTAKLTDFSVLGDTVYSGGVPDCYLRDLDLGEGYVSSVCCVDEKEMQAEFLLPAWVDLKKILFDF